MPRLGRLPDVDATLTMAARLDAFSAGSAERMQRTWLITFRSHADCQSSSVSCSNEAIRELPTLLTSTSRPPSASSAPATARSPPSGLERSTATAEAPISCAAAAGSREAIATAAPSACSARAVSRPMPSLAPVTRARMPVRSRSM